MSQEFYTIVTKKGQELVAASLSSGKKIQLSKMAVGDAHGVSYDPLESQTALKSEKYRVSLSRLVQDSSNPHWFIAEALIPDEVGGFYIREVGLYDEAGNLFALGKIPETYKPELTSGSDKQVYIRLVFQISNAESVTLMVDPSIIMVTQQALTENLNALDWKQTVRAATTENITLAGLCYLDEIELAENDRVLVKNQASQQENGLYRVSTGAWVRTGDFSGQLSSYGVMVPVSEGSENAKTLWMVPIDGVMNVGNEPVVFYKINSNFDTLLASDNVWTGVNTHAQPIRLTAAADDLPNIINKNTQHALVDIQSDGTETATYLATGAGDSLLSWVHFSPAHSKAEFRGKVGFLSNAKLFQNGIIERVAGIKKAKLVLFDGATGGLCAYESSCLTDGIIPSDSWLTATPVKDEHLTTKGYVDLQILLQGGSTQRGGIGSFIVHASSTQPSNTIRLTEATQLVKYDTYPELCDVIGTQYGPKQVKSEKVLDKAGYYETYLKTEGYYKPHTCGETTGNQKGTIATQSGKTVTAYNCDYSGSGPYYPAGLSTERWAISKPFSVGQQFVVTQIDAATKNPVKRMVEYHDPAGNWGGHDPYASHAEGECDCPRGHNCTTQCKTYYEEITRTDKITALTNYQSVSSRCDLSYVQPVYDQRWVAETYKNVNVDYYVIPTALLANNNIVLNDGLSISIIAK